MIQYSTAPEVVLAIAVSHCLTRPWSWSKIRLSPPRMCAQVR